MRAEQTLAEQGLSSLDAARMRELKRLGFSDARMAALLGTDEAAVRHLRRTLDVRPVYKRVDSCAAEFATSTAYMYSTYEEECEAEPSDRRKIMVLGGGPNRIGQGIEFDYCCVHAALALREDGYETIMVNCNPETVSTDYDTSDRLYFEPLTLEDVLEVVDKEKPEGVIVQYGGQTPLKLARALEAAGVPIIGTSPDSIDLAEDRERFQQLIDRLGLKQPPNRIARSAEQALVLAARDRLPAGGASQLRAGRSRHGDRLRRRRPGALHPRGGARVRVLAGAAGPLPRPRGRGRRGHHRRCPGQRADRRHHGAHRGGRRAFGRLLLLAAAVFADARDPGRAAPPGHPAGARAEGDRTDEHPVRRPGRERVHPRGQSARLAHRAVRVQGHRRSRWPRSPRAAWPAARWPSRAPPAR